MEEDQNPSDNVEEREIVVEVEVLNAVSNVEKIISPDCTAINKEGTLLSDDTDPLHLSDVHVTLVCT